MPKVLLQSLQQSKYLAGNNVYDQGSVVAVWVWPQPLTTGLNLCSLFVYMDIFLQSQDMWFRWMSYSKLRLQGFKFSQFGISVHISRFDDFRFRFCPGQINKQQTSVLQVDLSDDPSCELSYAVIDWLTRLPLSNYVSDYLTDETTILSVFIYDFIVLTFE